MTKKAFTLIELLVVVVIIGILFIALVSNVDFSVSEAKRMNVTTDFLAYQMAIERVCLEHKEITGNMDMLADQLNKHLDIELFVKSSGGSLASDREDPWGHTYNFSYEITAADLGSITIISAGSDGKFGTGDDISTSVTYKNTPYGYKVLTEGP